MSQTQSLQQQIVNLLGEDFFHDNSKDDPHYGASIPSDRAPFIADNLLPIIAEVHALLIDTGSEREVILEDEQLRDALINAFHGWEIPG